MLPTTDLPDPLGPVILHNLVQILWSYLLLKGALLIAGQPPRRVSGSSSTKPQRRTTRSNLTACETLPLATRITYNAAWICVLCTDLG